MIFLPIGKKSYIIESPKNISYSKIDYWRGIIDGDGSLGFKKNGNAYIALITTSENLYNDFKQFLETLNIYININKNKRDNCYNIVLLREKAQFLCKKLYYSNEFSLNRKFQLAQLIINSSPQKLTCLRFDQHEDFIIINNDLEESVKLLTNRNRESIIHRRYKLRKEGKLL